MPAVTRRHALNDKEHAMLITTELLTDSYRTKQRILAVLLAVTTFMLVLSGDFTSGKQAKANVVTVNESTGTVLSANPELVFNDALFIVSKAQFTKKKTVKVCKNKLVNLLRETGFKNSNLKEAWAIAMRESRGNAKSISSTQDYGVFQFNKFTHSSQKWWNVKKLLNAKYNAKIAFEMSRGGKTWYPWGLDGQGRVKAHVFTGSGWSKSRIKSDIEAPFMRFMKEFKSLPKQCR